MLWASPCPWKGFPGPKAGVGGEKVWPRLANNCQLGCYMQVAKGQKTGGQLERT